MISKKVVIIGAGIGGLTAACLMARNGCDVTVLEKNNQVGGKLNELHIHGFRFDTGPSLLTMPWVLDALFEYCGVQRHDYIELESLKSLCTYYFADGTKFVSYQDLKAATDEIRRIAPGDEQHYRDFLNYSKKLYDLTASTFIYHPLRQWTDLLQLPLSDALKIDAFTTVSNRVDKTFESAYLRQFFKRFATYNGSSPFKSPATLNVIPHVELNTGGFYIKGGMYSLAKAFRKLAEDLGAKFETGKNVEKIVVDNGLARGVYADADFFEADIVISNSDAYETYLKLLEKNEISTFTRKITESVEPSCSGYVLLLGTNKKWDLLDHHTIFFSTNYKREFEDIFDRGQLPLDPTIYVANTSDKDVYHAPAGGSNLFVLVNAPYMQKGFDANDQAYAEHIIGELENRGLKGLRESIVVREVITPQDFYEHYRSNRGSIYGTSSNNAFAAFMRPRNRSKSIKNLWLTGGSTHPGGGIPLCIISAFHACEVEISG
jgi:phytoene desaturase